MRINQINGQQGENALIFSNKFSQLQSNLFNTDTKGTALSVPFTQWCPYYRGRECMIFGISGTKQTVCNREVFIL